MIYGYCRISTRKQSIDRQVDNIKKEYPSAIIIKEEYTGAKMSRPKWGSLYKNLKYGDTVVFDEVSRMSRDADEGFKAYEDLYERGVELVFLKEPYVNTSMYKNSIQRCVDFTGDEIADAYIDAANKALMITARQQIQFAFEHAQKELDDLHQRTREGIEQARLAGKQIGLEKGTKLVTKKSIASKK